MFMECRGMHNIRPKPRNVWPSWDLPKGLEYISGAPVKPIQAASLRDFAIKTVFLLAVCSGRRCSELHALWIGEGTIFSEGGVTLYFSPRFLAKNELVNFSARPLFLPYLNKSKSRKHRLCCPVRALRWYIDRSKICRGETKALFITSKKPYKRAAKSTLASWLVEAISHAQRSHSERPRPHSIRAVACTWALARGLSIPEIVNTVAWRTENTFIKTYLKAGVTDRVPAGRFASAVVSQVL